MSTRFSRDIVVNGMVHKIELIRDGFNVWIVEQETDTKMFQAHLERFLDNTFWHYKEIKRNKDVSEHKPFRAMIEYETDVVDYMVWRYQRYMQEKSLI